MSGDAKAEATNYLQRYDRALMRTFGKPKRVFVRGQGIHLFDDDDRRYTDLLAGIAVNSLGHCHPEVADAVSHQLRELDHISNFFASPPQIELAERLSAMACQPDEQASARVFFTNSGTEANEAAFKITRRTGRRRIIAMDGSFHGRSIGALSVTSNASYREPFEPLPGDVTFVPFGDVDALAAELAAEPVAAVVVEPIQGENGVVPAPDGFLADAASLARDHGALFWVDEVQTGVGRCGAWLVSVDSGVTPDVVTLAKGLGTGFPIGACIATGPAADLFGPGSHGSTFGGNPVAARAGLTVLDVIERDGLLKHVTEVGDRLARAIEALNHPLIDHVRGRGLLRGVVLTDNVAPAVVELALDAGFVINAPRPGVLRLAPPLVITDDDLAPFVQALPGLLDQATA